MYKNKSKAITGKSKLLESINKKYQPVFNLFSVQIDNNTTIFLFTVETYSIRR